MPVSQFPTPLNSSHLAEPSGPQFLKLLDQVVQFATVQKVFKDLGSNVGLLTASTVLIWELSYDGLDASEAAVLDAHYEEAQGIFGGFSFRHPRTDVLYTDCHYVSYERDHLLLGVQSRTVVIEKRPA